MHTRWQLRLLGSGAGLAAAAPAWGQSGADPVELAKTLGSGVVWLLLTGLLIACCWLGIPLALGLVAWAMCRRRDPAHRAGVGVPLLLATMVWVGGLCLHEPQPAAQRPAAGDSPGAMAGQSDLEAQSLLLVPGLLALATLGAAVAGYFAVRAPRLPPVPPAGA